MKEGDRPSCTCVDFLRNSYPCKHIIANWLMPDGGLCIPETDANPWWTLDPVVLPTDSASADIQHATEDPFPGSPISASLASDDDDVSHLPPAQPVVIQADDDDANTVNEKIREILNILKSYTYLNTDASHANNILHQLQDVQRNFTAALPKQHNIPTLPKSAMRKRKRKFRNLTKKSALKPRDGRPAKYRKFSKFCRFSDFVVSDLKSCHTSSPVEEDSERNHLEQQLASIAAVKPRADLSSKTGEQSEPSKTKTDADVGNPECTNNTNNSKARAVNTKILDGEYWLSSDDMLTILNIMSNQFSTIQTQDPLLIQRQQCFQAVDSCKEYCQILHINGNHWVAVTNIRCKPNHVQYYDSLGGEPTQKALQAIASKL